jgi:cardiolipin synthase
MEHAVMHAKTAVIDGVLSTVGSSNLDWRSIVGNSEMDVIVLGDDFASEMQALFKRDQAASRRIDAQQWAKRGFSERLMESLGRLLEPLL